MKLPALLIRFLTLSGVVLLAGCSHRNPPGLADRPDSSARADSSVQRAGASDSLFTYEERQGRFLYRKYCIVCHGEEGKGDGFNAYNLDPKPRDFTDSSVMRRLTDERILQTIAGGGRSVNRSPLMPSWGGRLGPAETRYLLAYVRFLGKARP
jgi:mono/diheme cytochrome c family protein